MLEKMDYAPLSNSEVSVDSAHTVSNIYAWNLRVTAGESLWFSTKQKNFLKQDFA